MNVVLIPFFLAATIPVAEKWSYGPEFVFHANLTYLLSADPTCDPFFNSNLSAVLKCRPKSEDSILCGVHDMLIASTNAGEAEAPEKSEFEQPFVIKFNRRGIDSIAFPRGTAGLVYNSEHLNVFRSFVAELNVGVDLQENGNALPAFVSKSKYTLGECATLFTVLQYDKSSTRVPNEPEEEHSYTLDLMSLPTRKPGSTVLIEKRTDHKRCTHNEHSFYTKMGIDIKSGKSITKMQITDAGTFKSQTEMHLKAGKPPGPKDKILQQISCVELKDIVPATEELPAYSFDEIVTLGFTDNVAHNIIQ